MDVDHPNEFFMCVVWLEDVEVAAECVAGHMRGIGNAVYGTCGEQGRTVANEGDRSEE